MEEDYLTVNSDGFDPDRRNKLIPLPTGQPKQPYVAKMGLIGTLPNEKPTTTKGQDIAIGVGKALLPDLTDPKEAAEYFVDLRSSVKMAGPYKGAALFAGKRLIQEIPQVQKGLQVLDDTAAFLFKNSDNWNPFPAFKPAVQAVTPDGTTIVTRNVDEFVPSSTFQYSDGLTTGPGGKPRYKTPVAKLDDRPLSRQGSKTVGSTEEISNRHLSELELKQGRAMYGYQRTVLGGSPHHFALDLELSGNALNRVDDAQIVKALAQNHNIRPGNVKSNFIMAYHDKSTKMRLAYQLEIKRLRELKGLPPLDQRVLDDLTKTVDPKFKNITVGKHKFKIEITDGGLPKTKTYNPDEYYSRFRKIAGIDPKDIRIDPRNTVLGRDHIEIIHAANDALPERQALMELVKSEKWRTIPPKEAADRLAEVADLQSNIAINVSKWRYQQIKRYINKNIAQGDIHNWTPKRIQKWMIDNPHLSANIGWYPRKGELPPTLAKLRQPPKGNWKEVAEVFGLEFDTASQSKIDELVNFFNTPGKALKIR